MDINLMSEARREPARALGANGGGTPKAMGSRRQFAVAVQTHSPSHVEIGDHIPISWTSYDLADNLFAKSRCQLGTAYFLRGTVRTGSLVRVSPSGLAS